jgi:glycosyltransferase involved in cell wall biosynthesis
MDIGGAERAVYQLVREQRRRGIEADVLVGRSAGFYGELAREAGATVHELHQRRAFDLLAARRSRPVLREYEMVHFHAPEPALMQIAAGERRQRCFYTHRGGIRRYSVAKRIRHSFVRRALRGFDGVSANTFQSALAASAIFGLSLESIQVVYNGIDFSLLQPERGRDDVLRELGLTGNASRVVGTAANLQRWKRVDRLVHAVAALRNDGVQCLVVGDGPARGELEDLSRQLGVSDRVTFAGQKPHVGDYLQVMDAFVLPSGPEEAFGNAVVEAMGMGVPPIVFSDGGGLTEHISNGESGFIVIDQADLERRLRELLADDSRRAEIGASAMAAARTKYSLEAMVVGYEALYAESCQTPDRRRPTA